MSRDCKGKWSSKGTNWKPPSSNEIPSSVTWRGKDPIPISIAADADGCHCRLGRLDEKFAETEAQISVLEERIMEREKELLLVQRERSELKGALASTEGELKATKVEAGHETKRLEEKVGWEC